MLERYVHFSQYDANNALITIRCPEVNEQGVEVQAQKGLVREDKQIETFIHTSLKYRNEQKARSWEGKHHTIDVNDYFYDKSTKTIPIGLIPRLCRMLKLQYPRIHITLSNDIDNMYRPPRGKITADQIKAYAATLHLHNDVDNFDLTVFDHQVRLVERALNGRRISLLACTSAGKSLSMMIIARYLMERENKKILIVVPSSNLVKQLFRDFHVEYGWKEAGEYCTQIYGTSKDKLSKKDLEKLKSLNVGEEVTLKRITISTWQSLARKDESFFKVFSAVIVDEAHSTRGEELRSILAMCSNANDFKIGVSGTLPDNGLDAAYIESAIGRKEEIVRLKELINLGILTPVTVQSIYVPYPVKYRPLICDTVRCKYEDEKALVTNNSSRRDLLNMIINNPNAASNPEALNISINENTVILFKTIENLELMHEFLLEKHPEFNYYVIKGDITPDEREEIRLHMEKSTGNIIIATYGCMQQGVNIKQLHNLVFAEPSKSPYVVVQSIGRVVRKHKNKTHAVVYDFVDDASYMTRPRGQYGSHIKVNRMMAHYYERCKYYAADDIPLKEHHLDGFYEAQPNIEDIKARKKKAAENAEKRKNSGSPYKRKFFH